MLLQRCTLHKNCNTLLQPIAVIWFLGSLHPQVAPFPSLPSSLYAGLFQVLQATQSCCFSPLTQTIPPQLSFALEQLLHCLCRFHWSSPQLKGVENSMWWFPPQLALSNMWQFSTTLALPGMMIQKGHATAYFQPEKMEFCRVLLPQI